MAVNNISLIDLQKSLYFLHVGELREICLRLCIPEKGLKLRLIARIMHFIPTGEVIKEPKMPDISRAKRGEYYPLHPEALILKGAYKNDLKTRLFFKSLIGEHFHFTAFGIDWINERWMSGLPPSYQEFVDMWKAEGERRKKNPETPKVEWAYIHFTQDFLKANPEATRSEVIDAWKHVHQINKEIVYRILF